MLGVDCLGRFNLLTTARYIMMMNVARPPPSLVRRIGRRSPATRAAASVFNDDARHLSSMPSRKPQHSHTAGNNEPWWSLSSLHKRIATVIATSLPDESLTTVHKSLSEKLNGVDSHKSVSINEAIVSARAREVHQNQLQGSSTNGVNGEDNTNKQKQLEEEIEQRALARAHERMALELAAMEAKMKRDEEERMKVERERIEKELKREVAFERWQDSVAREREEEYGKKNMNAVEVEGSSINGVQEEELAADVSMSPEQQQDHHPILGPQIAQLDYKRIHLTSAATLATLPVYEKQRAYRHDRAQVMAKDKKRTLWMGIPGVISLMEDDDGRLSILDGQHRVGMMSLLQEEQRRLLEKGSGTVNEGLVQLDLNSVLVEVFFPRQSLDDGNTNADSDDDDDSIAAKVRKQTEKNDRAAEIFTEINKAEPIKLLDLPGVATKRTRDIIDHAASHFHDTFPAMFSSSQRCRAPHLNLDNLRDALFASEVIKREKVGSGSELVKWMVGKNDELKAKFEGDVSDGELDDGKKLSGAALNKARKYDFYLGLESTWLYK